MGKTGGFKFWAVTMALMLVAAFCCVGTVLCREDFSAQSLESDYRAKEKQLLCEARAFLSSKGFENSGVMLTHVTEVDGSRQYTMTVHHAGIEKMCDEDRQELFAGLLNLVFEESLCSFVIK